MSNDSATVTTLNTTAMTDIVATKDFATTIILLLYGIIFVVGIAGNAFACGVVLFKHSMRKSIHFYTFNLSVADILILIVYVPTQMRLITDGLDWKMGGFVCSMAYCVIPLSLQTSVGTLVAISVDRFRGLMYPFAWRSDSKRNSKIIIPIIWGLAIALASPIAYYAQVVAYDNGMTICWDNLPKRYAKDQLFELTYWSLVMVLQYILPFLTIAGLHIYMALRITKGRHTINLQHKRMMLMVVALLTTYLICTGMQHVVFYLSVYDEAFESSSNAPYLFIISNLLISLQAAINPLVYCTSRSDFKSVYTTLIKKIGAMTKCRNLQNNISLLKDNLKRSDGTEETGNSIVVDTIFGEKNRETKSLLSTSKRPSTDTDDINFLTKPTPFFHAIISDCYDKVVPCNTADKVVPCNTAVQNKTTTRQNLIYDSKKEINDTDMYDKNLNFSFSFDIDFQKLNAMRESCI